MTTRRVHLIQWATAWHALLVTTALVATIPYSAPAQSTGKPPAQAATIYWCPNRPADQQITAAPEPGCAPLAQPPKSRTGTRAAQKSRPPIKMEHIQSEATQFLDRYHQFLDCCADDVAGLDRVRDLETEASNLLQSIQRSGIYNLGTIGRQYALGEIVRQVAQARRELDMLETRLERIGTGMDRLEGQDPERAARAARELEMDREAITKDFRSKRAKPSARTGVNIQDTTVPNWYGESPTGTSSLRSTTGTDIGQDSGLPTRPGDQIRDTTLMDRPGNAAEDTSLRSSTGFGIDHMQNTGGSSTRTRVGPDVGDSSLNR